MIDDQAQNQKESLSTHAMAENPHVLLLRWLSPDEEQAVRRYQNLRQKLVVLFARRGVFSSVAEELADETLERTGHRLAAGEVIRHAEPMAYLHGVAKNVLLEYWRKQQKQAGREIPLDDLLSLNINRVEFSLPHQNEWEEQKERQRLLECLDKSLSTLSPEDEALLRTCYHEDSNQQAANRRAAAKRLNLMENSLRANLHRLCQTLKRKVRACVERHQK